MKRLEELISHDELGIDLIRQWTDSAKNHCEILPPSRQRDDVLLKVQVTTRSPLGAVAHETGGILIDHGWLRFLGSGQGPCLIEAKVTEDLKPAIDAVYEASHSS